MHSNGNTREIEQTANKLTEQYKDTEKTAQDLRAMEGKLRINFRSREALKSFMEKIELSKL